MQLKRSGLGPRTEDGFTLIELLITLVIVSVGMLGLVKLQAAAMSETSTARTRSIMAYQAESLAGAMRANRAFWAGAAASAPNVTVPAGTSTSITDNTGTLGTPPAGGCTSSSNPCKPEQLARWDLDQWKSTFSTQFPTATATVACGTSTGPTTCDITLNWGEHYVAINRTTAAASAAFTGTGTMIVHIQP